MKTKLMHIVSHLWSGNHKAKAILNMIKYLWNQSDKVDLIGYLVSCDNSLCLSPGYVMPSSGLCRYLHSHTHTPRETHMHNLTKCSKLLKNRNKHNKQEMPSKNLEHTVTWQWTLKIWPAKCTLSLQWFRMQDSKFFHIQSMV